MQLRIFSLLTILFLNTNQIYTMYLLNNLSQFFGLSLHKPETQTATIVTAKKMMIPLIEFPNATEEEKKLIISCNNLNPDNSDNYIYGDIDIYRHHFLAFLEKHSIETKKHSKIYGEEPILSENNLGKYLKRSRSILQ